MSTKDSTVKVKMTTATPVKKEETVLPSPASEVGLAGLSTVDSVASREVGRGADVIQRTQIGNKGPLKKPKEAVKEKAATQKTPPSPAQRPHRFALEVTFTVENSAGEFTPVDEETYSADFLVDTFNLVYPGCTGIYLMEAGHVIAFYGKKGTTRAGLSVEQSVDACQDDECDLPLVGTMS